MSSHAEFIRFEPAIWARLMDPHSREIPPEAARFLLSIEFGELDRERMQYLADRSEAGALTSAEEAEFDGYLNVGTFLALMQSRARVSLGITLPIISEPS